MGLFGDDVLIGRDNLAGHIWISSRGDYEFRIIGCDRFVTVAEVDFVAAKRNSSAQKFIRETTRAFQSWFGNPRYQREIVKAVKINSRRTSKEWRDIKEEYNLSSDYDKTIN